ncbi:hypothetical protein DFJ73DRAFT_755833 [Zopfochytrium polystomum]|nr:hypothetical protein DFJ73DRAFT_755833 [Zopfochytrium polystomum]
MAPDFESSLLAAKPTFVPITEDGNLAKRVISEAPQSEDGGDLPLIAVGSTVSVHYTGFLHPSGKKFDSSRDRGQPLKFNIGRGQVISGWELGIVTMRVGERAELMCGPDYAYGESGNPPTIPSNATLMFDVEVVEYAQLLKETGNSQFKSGDFKTAGNTYKLALDRLAYTWGANPLETREITALKLALNLNMAAAWIKTGDLRFALEACNRALAIQPENIKAMFRMAQAHAGLSHFEQAITALQKAQEIDPDDPSILKEIAKVMEMKKALSAKEKRVYQAMFR